MFKLIDVEPNKKSKPQTSAKNGNYKKNVRKKLFTYCSVSPYSLTDEVSGRTFLSFLLHSTLINRYRDKNDREIDK